MTGRLVFNLLNEILQKQTNKQKDQTKNSSDISCLQTRRVLVIAWFRVQLTINLTSGN